ncbi:hypothetical protein Ancab_030858 [Ancistrocladus abbreviatus]
MAATPKSSQSSTLPLEDRVAIVTGSSRGVGRGVALHLALLGAKVVVNYLSSTALGMMDTTLSLIAETSVESFDKVFNLNTKGMFLCVREATNRLKRGGGRIITFSGTCLQGYQLGFAVYYASLKATEAMTKFLAKELKGTMITANCVALGAMKAESYPEGPRADGILELCVNASPLLRLGELHDVAALIGFLVSDDGEWVTGQVIGVDGAPEVILDCIQVSVEDQFIVKVTEDLSCDGFDSVYLDSYVTGTSAMKMSSNFMTERTKVEDSFSEDNREKVKQEWRSSMISLPSENGSPIGGSEAAEGSEMLHAESEKAEDDCSQGVCNIDKGAEKGPSQSVVL